MVNEKANLARRTEIGHTKRPYKARRVGIDGGDDVESNTDRLR